jgi:hypothetical protein
MGAVALHPGHILLYDRDEALWVLGGDSGAEAASDALPVKS